VAVILISIYARDIHLDVDAVLVGEIAFAPFDRLTMGGADLGPRGLWVMGGILLINLVFVALLYKELKLTTFDAGLAATLGFAPALLHYALMSLVSVTVVGAFDIVGSVLVVALMVAPPAAASLISERLPGVLLWSLAIGAASALGGYALAYVLDASIAGAMASMAGVWFTLALLFAPRRGLLAEARRRRTQREAFAVTMLTAHLLNHEAKPEAEMENRMSHLGEHLRWGADFAARVVRLAERQGLLQQSGGALRLTEAGRAHAQSEFIR
ncbi:MAG: metal ABC transporter permease, partial [Anaerolineae bacterium]|nr:metal ABC transporter permease [Anaerolineae bacterium]